MRIGILTQPLFNNYGGLLQNYALQTILKKLGHEVCTINIKYKEITHFHKYVSVLKRVTLRTLGQDIRIRVWPTRREAQKISQHTRKFVQKNIKTTDLITKKVDEDILKQYAFDAYIVGSDQVWRPMYSPQLPTFFLDFLEDNHKVEKITYAASFGVNDWEFTDAQTKEFGRLLKLFDAVSVREDSAVTLCRDRFGVDAVHLLDPTMLLDKDAYISLVEKEQVKESPGNLFSYILDSSSEKNKIVDTIANKFVLNAFSVMQPKRFSDLHRQGVDDCIFPPVEEWIRGFMDAQFVVTDSFHGTVFSILFNKPFISIANKSRGLTRFTSLLKLFRLGDRLVYSSGDFNPESLNEIDWEKTNRIMEREKEKSIQFLKKN